MKAELATAVGAAIAGVLIAFFVTNMFIGEIEDVEVKTVDSIVSADLADPDPEVFNYKALNPTVEVYVGDCAEYDASGMCIQQVTEEDIIDLEIPTESKDTDNNNSGTTPNNSTNPTRGTSGSESSSNSSANSANQRNQ